MRFLRVIMIIVCATFLMACQKVEKEIVIDKDIDTYTPVEDIKNDTQTLPLDDQFKVASIYEASSTVDGGSIRMQFIVNSDGTILQANVNADNDANVDQNALDDMNSKFEKLLGENIKDVDLAFEIVSEDMNTINALIECITNISEQIQAN